jgi:aldose 1-epimerase
MPTANIPFPNPESSLTANTEIHMDGTIEKSPFGAMPDGRAVEIFTLRNRQGTEARIMTYGGILVSLKAADKNGKFDDVVLGYEKLDGYLASSPYFGALIGRYGNRIAKGKFSLNGRNYTLATNNGVNHLHGGLKGFDKVVWKSRPRLTSNGPSLQLEYLSKDGEEGFPGNLSVTVIYTLTNDNALRLDFTATSDQDTICNLTHHSYFNLRGSGDILDHEFQINADTFTAVDETLIPTGEFRAVSGTPYDLRKSSAIRQRISEPHDQLKIAGGYDQNFVINKPPGELGQAARVFEAVTGRVVEVFTTEPGMQFYTGNFLNGTLLGKGGRFYQKRDAFCLEPQHHPDSPNHPNFPSVVLRPGETYKQTSLYRFSVQ